MGTLIALLIAELRRELKVGYLWERNWCREYAIAKITRNMVSIEYRKHSRFMFPLFLEEIPGHREEMQ